MAQRPFIDRILRPFARGERRSVTVAPSSVTGGFVSAPIADFGVHVTNKSAMNLTAFFAGLRILSENVASLPKSVYVEGDNGVIASKSHRISRLLQAPNTYTNKETFFAVMTTWLKGWGNAYAVIQRDDAGVAVALHQVHPASVTVRLIDGRKWYKVLDNDPQHSWLNKVYSDDDMLHIMDVSLDGVVGVNPVLYNAMAIGKGLATEKFVGEFYKAGGHVKAVLETEHEMGDEAFVKFMTHYKESTKNFGTPLLEQGVKYKQASIDPVASQLIQSEVLSIQDICRILGIPPHMLAEMSHATFSNIEHQTIQFVQYTLRPIVKKFEVEMESKLLFEKERETHDIKFSLDGLLRGDTKARSEYYHNAILDGYMSRNEVRALEGLDHKDGLDDMLYPLNTGVVGKENENNE